MLKRSDRRAIRAVALAAAGVAAVGVLFAVTRTDDGPTRADEAVADRDGVNAGVVPTIPGGVELAPVDPAVLLVGDGLAFGTPLPSEEAAGQAFTASPEVTSVVTRRVYEADGRRLGRVLVLHIDGHQLFDAAALTAFERTMVSQIGGAPVEEVPMGGRNVLQATKGDRAAIAFRQGDQLSIVTASTAHATSVATRQIEAQARGEVGSLDPVTPLPPTPVLAGFVPLSTVSFLPIPPPEEEPITPEVPTFPGAAAVEGRYGVVAGERRTVVWAFALDRGAYPTAEALAPALPGLVSSRAGGAPAEANELIDRVVLSATNPPGTRSARAFRHQGLVLLVEGDRPDQLDAVVTAWITALGPT